MRKLFQLELTPQFLTYLDGISLVIVIHISYPRCSLMQCRFYGDIIFQCSQKFQLSKRDQKGLVLLCILTLKVLKCLRANCLSNGLFLFLKNVITGLSPASPSNHVIRGHLFCPIMKCPFKTIL